jgi:hypothetical protein
MGCLGVHFALTAGDVAALRAFGSDKERLQYLTEELEERELAGPWSCETDKTWDAIHRCFASGSLDPTAGEYPLNHIILGGESLYSADDYIMSLKTPGQVAEIARDIASITKEQMKSRYDKIDPNDYGMPLSDEDFEATWGWFGELVSLYHSAAEGERFVLFTADQ